MRRPRGSALVIGLLVGAAVGAAVVLDRERRGSALARSREALAEERRAWGLLVRRFAHDLRNPLTAIKARTELLRRKMDGRPDEQRHVEAVLRAVDRLDAKIGELSSAGRQAAPGPAGPRALH